MESVARSRGRGLWESLYRVLMRRNSVYVTFVVAGAFAGERIVDYGVHKLWEYNNVGFQQKPAGFVQWDPLQMCLNTLTTRKPSSTIIALDWAFDGFEKAATP